MVRLGDSGMTSKELAKKTVEAINRRDRRAFLAGVISCVPSRSSRELTPRRYETRAASSRMYRRRGRRWC